MKSLVAFLALVLAGALAQGQAQVGNIRVNGKDYVVGGNYTCRGPLVVTSSGATCNGQPLLPDELKSKSTSRQNPCAPEKAAPHSLGGGFVSANSRVDARVTVPESTSICGDVKVPKSVIIGPNVLVSGKQIEFSEGAKVGPNVEISGTGRIGPNTDIGPNASINGDFNLENTKISPNANLKGRIYINGVNVDGRMENCDLRGSATEAAKTTR